MFFIDTCIYLLYKQVIGEKYMLKNIMTSFGLIALLALSACGGGAEENARPDPVDLSQFKEGTTHFDVIGAVGQPQGSVTQTGRPYDIYKLYTSGLTSGAKAAMAFGEGITDVATLGIAEIGWSAVHAGTRPRIHTVLFGYDPNHEKLVDIYDKDPSRTEQSIHTIIDKKLYMTPIVLPAPKEAPIPEAGHVTLETPVNTSATPNTDAVLQKAEPIANKESDTDALNNASSSQATKDNAATNAYYKEKH